MATEGPPPMQEVSLIPPDDDDLFASAIGVYILFVINNILFLITIFVFNRHPLHFPPMQVTYSYSILIFIFNVFLR